MPPVVEGFFNKELLGNINFFSINLGVPEPLDINYFDRLFKKAFPPGLNGEIQAKYIVCGDVMYIFNKILQHDEFYIAKVGGLQSAGRVGVVITEKGIERRIFDYSANLNQCGSLSREQSDTYKKTEIGEKLGFYFKIE